MDDKKLLSNWEKAWTNLGAAIAAPQVGVINHGDGLDVDYAEMEERLNGYEVMRHNGHSRLYRTPKAVE